MEREQEDAHSKTEAETAAIEVSEQEQHQEGGEQAQGQEPAAETQEEIAELDLSAAVQEQRQREHNQELEVITASINDRISHTEDAKMDESKRISKAAKQHIKEMKGALSELKTPQEQVALMEKKYFENYRSMLQMESETLTSKRLIDGLRKEKAQAIQELARSQLTRSKLELLCKEYQKQNKLIVADSKRVALEEQKHRAELSEKFQATIKDISEKMDLHGDEREKQHRQNEMLREKLTSLVEQLEQREKHFETRLHAKDLEKQIEEAKARHQTEIAKQEAAKAMAYKAQAEHLARNEIEYKQTIATYSEKFEQFKETLTSSNNTFQTYKKEMDKLAKRIKELEKENAKIKTTVAKKELALAQSQADHKKALKDVEAIRIERDKFEKICRGLQLDRNALKETVHQLKLRLGEPSTHDSNHADYSMESLSAAAEN